MVDPDGQVAQDAPKLRTGVPELISPSLLMGNDQDGARYSVDGVLHFYLP